ncbi:MAG: hypothetical protein L3J52_06130, partial [Proteobacteria bacterium]|nr:hypothetical protein [Pseudomonadota bacterium]
MKYLTFFITIIFTIPVHSFVIWPGATAPCNTTLQACVDGSPDGEYIEIRTNIITETIVTTKPVSLVAGAGYQPTFTAGNHLEMTSFSSVSRTLTIQGLTFVRGRIAYTHWGTGDITLNIRRNQILDNNFLLHSMRIQQFFSPTMTLNIDYNQINHDFGGSNDPNQAAVFINKAQNSNTGQMIGRFYGNTVSVIGSNSRGLGLFDSTSGSFSLNITGNEFTGGVLGAISADTSDFSDGMDLDISSNAIYKSQQSTALMRGIYARTDGSTIELDVVNNTIINAWDGLNLLENGTGTIDAYIYNNIIAFGSAPVWTDLSTISNDYNLLYQNSFSDPDFTPGANHINTNPLLKGLNNGRLRPGSPAIEAGFAVALIAVFDAPFIDADGLIRVKKGDSSGGAAQVDIGAYETGDVFFTHYNTGTASHITTLDHPSLNGVAGLDDLHVTSNWNPLGVGGIYNEANEAVYYVSGAWRVFNEGFQDIITGAAFNLYKFANTNNTIEQAVIGSTQNNTIINHSSLNNQSDRILQVSQHWTGEYNPHPFGVFYFSGSWVIINFDLINMLDGANFNVYSQASSKSAWEHIEKPANIFGNSTVLNHPLL